MTVSKKPASLCHFPPSCSLPGVLLQPKENCCCHLPAIPKEEHQSLVVRLFGFLLIKYSTYKVLNKYTFFFQTPVYHTHTLGELYVFIYKISWEAIYQMQSKLQNNSTPQTHCPSPGCSPHSRHTRTLTHTCLCSLTPGKKSSTLHNLATWEMFMLMPQMHSGGGRAPSCTGLNSTRVLQAAAWKRFCLQGPAAWGSRSGEGGFAGLGRLTGELS